MEMSNAEVIFTTIQIFMALILTGGLPWAIVMERRLARIEANIEGSIRTDGNISKDVKRNSDLIRDHEGRILKLEVRTYGRSKNRDDS